MSSYKGIVIPPSLTKTAGGQDMYIPLDPVGGGGDIIPGNLQVGGNLAVDGSATVDGAVSCASTLAVTGAATCSSTLAVTGPATMSDLTATGNVILSTNPAANGVSIGTSVLPSGVGGLTVAGLTTLATANITALGLNSFGAVAPTGFGGNGQWTIVLAGMRFVYQRVVSNGAGPNPGLFAIITPLSYWSGGAAAAGSLTGQCSAVASLIGGASFSPRFSNGGRVDGSNMIVDGFIGDGSGTAQPGTSVSVMIYGPA